MLPSLVPNFVSLTRTSVHSAYWRGVCSTPAFMTSPHKAGHVSACFAGVFLSFSENSTSEDGSARI